MFEYILRLEVDTELGEVRFVFPVTVMIPFNVGDVLWLDDNLFFVESFVHHYSVSKGVGSTIAELRNQTWQKDESIRENTEWMLSKGWELGRLDPRAEDELGDLIIEGS